MLGIISAKVTAVPGASGWAQVHEYTPDDPERVRVRGRLFAVMATSKTQEGIDTITSGRELIGRLHEEYFGNLEAKPFDCLKNAIQKVADEFKGVWGDVEIAASAFVDGVIFSVATGGSRVIICREGALATILESQSEVISASGYPKEGDLILLATKAFFQKIPLEVIKTALTSGSTERAAETFNPLVHGEEGNGNLGAAIMKFEAQEPVQSESQDVASPAIQNSEPKISLKQKVTSFFDKIGKKFPARSIYIKSPMGDEVSSQSKKMTFSIGVILLVILIVSIGFGIRQKRINDIKNDYQGKLQVAQNQVDEAISLASVSPEKSRELFISSEQILEEILNLKVDDASINVLQQKIEESRGVILGEYDGTPSPFLDLSLLSSGFTGDAVSATGGNIYILDKAGKRVVSVATDTKKSKVTAGPSVIDTAFDIASYEDTVYVLGSDGIYEVGTGKTKVIEKTWTGEALISAFAGNLYVLDKAGNMIYRYSGLTGGTFGTQQKWLSAATTANFAGAIGWGMDGAIYVLYPNAKVLKYSLGSPQNFSISGVLPEIGNIDAISAGPDNQYIYLLDKAGKRVVVIDKKGNYKAQYTSDQIAGAKALVVSEAQKQIILLTGDKLLSIEIKN
jgi:DNA-binding beta-propeller fold protein YncE